MYWHFAFSFLLTNQKKDRLFAKKHQKLFKKECFF